MFFDVVCSAVMFRPVVGEVGGSRAPVVFELSLCYAVTKPVEPHVHSLGATWLNVVRDDAKGGTIVRLNGCRWLFVSHLR